MSVKGSKKVKLFWIQCQLRKISTVKATLGTVRKLIIFPEERSREYSWHLINRIDILGNKNVPTPQPDKINKLCLFNWEQWLRAGWYSKSSHWGFVWNPCSSIHIHAEQIKSTKRLQSMSMKTSSYRGQCFRYNPQNTICM